MSTMSLVVVALLLSAALMASVASARENTTVCQDSCGGMAIEYPFGIGGAGCFRGGFELACDGGTTPVLAGAARRVPVDRLSIRTAEARVLLPVAWQCFNASDEVEAWSSGDVQLNGGGGAAAAAAYRISSTHNQVVVVGCNTLGYTQGQRSEGSDYSYAYYTGCLAFCNNSGSAADGACAGVGCCRVDIPPGLTDSSMSFRAYSHAGRLGFSPCDYAFLVDRGSYTFRAADLRMDRNRTMPVWLDWAIRDGGGATCGEARTTTGYACKSDNSYCRDTAINGPGYVCNCSKGYQGNPYIVDGCTDINECEHGDEYPCRGVCRNTPGSYECKCPRGSHSSDPFKETCNPNFPLGAQVSVGVLGGLFVILVLVSILLVRKAKREMDDCFKRNGGQILEEVGNIKLFRKEELKPILKTDNLIGQGGFGQVYKGHIGENGQLVAVKKPKNISVNKPKGVAVTESNKDGSAQKNQFVNEVIIQSRISHQNIVKLIGCCLEVDMPILVYEFVTQGSLDDILHGSSRRALDLYQRLDIAMQSADGLAYMHSEKTPVLHGDVKPSNILLHDGFVPKISDFGISRLITVDKRYTLNVIGDLSYVDPVYLQSGLLTSKSDVYSFGIVLLEIITRKKASDSDNSRLFRTFDAYTKELRVIEFVDPEIGIMENIELLESLAGMILKCLDLKVDQRPDMSDLVEFLRNLMKRSQCKEIISCELIAGELMHAVV
ncbi:hypothetical protein ACP4OV_010379 [Aristida adscensionis]